MLFLRHAPLFHCHKLYVGETRNKLNRINYTFIVFMLYTRILNSMANIISKLSAERTWICLLKTIYRQVYIYSCICFMCDKCMVLLALINGIPFLYSTNRSKTEESLFKTYKNVQGTCLHRGPSLISSIHKLYLYLN